MEKTTAHYPLTRVKALVKAGAVAATRSALEGAAEIGFSFKQMKDIVNALEAKDLRKSMTSNQDNTLWQDVYSYPHQKMDIYLKIQIVENVVIISFKEL